MITRAEALEKIEIYKGETYPYYIFDNVEEILDLIYDDVEELELFKSEHLRLEAELNAILHPNGDGPSAPSFCDLVAYVRADLKPKTCEGCRYVSYFSPHESLECGNKDCNFYGCDVDYTDGCNKHEQKEQL